MRVFITGASGFLGGALARAISSEGAEVHALRRSTTDPGALSDIPITWHYGDITDRESLNGAFRGMDWIIHAAGRLGHAGESDPVYRTVNVEGTRNVMAETLAAGGSARVLHLSSPGVLGPTGPDPAAEESPIAASNPYERSKAAAEEVALDFAAKGLAVIIARPGFVYGPGDLHVLSLFKAVKSGRFFYIDDGRHLCQPTFIADVVEGMLACLRRGQPGEVYHLCGPRTVSFRELGEIIAAAVGSSPPHWNVPRWPAMLGASILEFAGRLGGWTPPLGRSGVSFFSEDRVFSLSKARDQLNYLPRHEPAVGVPITADWYRRHGWL